MAEFIIRPHGRLHDWIADDQGYFREEGLSYLLVGDEERENRPKEVDPATGALRDVRSGAYEMYQQGGGAKGDKHSDISCACPWTVNQAVAKNVGRMWGSARAAQAPVRERAAAALSGARRCPAVRAR